MHLKLMVLNKSILTYYIRMSKNIFYQSMFFVCYLASIIGLLINLFDKYLSFTYWLILRFLAFIVC